MPPAVRRRLHRGTEEEDASQLKLGFSSLFVPLTKCRRRIQRRSAPNNIRSQTPHRRRVDATTQGYGRGHAPDRVYPPMQTYSSVMKKTQEYLGSFARFQTTEAIHAVER